jgi:hypothetical protein
VSKPLKLPELPQIKCQRSLPVTFSYEATGSPPLPTGRQASREDGTGHVPVHHWTDQEIVSSDQFSPTSFTLLRKNPRSSRPWMNVLRVPYEARTSVVGYASEGSALRSMWRSRGLQPVEAPFHKSYCQSGSFWSKRRCLEKRNGPP